MIILANKDLVMTKYNIMKLSIGIEGKALYVDKETYDQAVVLSNLYDTEDGVIDLLTKITTDNSCSNYIDAIHYFYENAPSPVNILAPFISMTKSKDNVNSDLIELLSIVDAISRMVNFYKSTRVDKNLLKSILISKDTLKEYTDQISKFEEQHSSMDKAERVSILTLDDVVEKVKELGLEMMLSTSEIKLGGGVPAYSQDNAEEEEEELDLNDLDSIFAAIGNGMAEYEEEEIKQAEEIEVESEPVFEEEIVEEVEVRELTPQEIKDIEMRNLLERIG